MSIFKRLYYLSNWFRVKMLAKGLTISIHTRINKGTLIITEDQSSIRIKEGFHSRRNVTIHSFQKGRITLGNNVFINENSIIVSCNEIDIGENVTIGPNTVIYDHDHDFKNGKGYKSKKIVIEDNVWIGAGCIILKGVTIGAGAVVAAGTVVTHDVSPDSVIIDSKKLVEKHLNNWK